LIKHDPIPFLGNFINGEFHSQGLKDEEWSNLSPANHSEVVANCKTSYSHVDECVVSAKKAFVNWSNLKMEERIESVLLVKEAFEKNREALELTIARETGKPLWECKTEVNAMIGKFAVTIDHSLKLIEEQKIKEIAPGVDGYIRFVPRGVLAVLGPFNFPGHLPNGHIVPALIAGNTIVFKPSELTPMTAQVIASCFQEAKIPSGVFNLVQGGGYDSLVGSFLTAGQRCSGTSRIFLHEKIHDEFLDKFYEKAKKLKIGHWNSNSFMGPLISGKSVDGYLRFQEIALREGAEKIMRGKIIEPDVTGNYVTPSIYTLGSYDAKSVYQNSEIFGPNVAIYKINDMNEPIVANNTTGYGLSMAVFSKDKEIYTQALKKAKVGLLNWNRTTNGASSRLPFGGCGKSGNGRPAAHFAVYYSTNAVASLEDQNSFDQSKILPGVEW